MCSRKLSYLVYAVLFFDVCSDSHGKSHDHSHSKHSYQYPQNQHHYSFPIFHPFWRSFPRYEPYPVRYRYPQYSYYNNYNNYNYNNYGNEEYRQEQLRAEGPCGVSLRVNQLIVHGEEFDEGTFPWLAALFEIRSNGPAFICGGTLVSKKHIITAAHCVKRNTTTVDANKFLVVLGKCNLQKLAATDSNVFKVAKVFAHSDYKFLSADGDIGVLELQDNLNLTETIRPACLWSGSDSLEDIVRVMGVVAGWGKTETGDLSLIRPKFVQMPIVSQETCLRSNSQFSMVTSERTFCAGSEDGSGPCNGDSGSGLMIQRGGQWVLRGLVSLSLSSGVPALGCDLSLYIVFTDISKFADWLYSVIK